jgi:hypothetical protein
VIQQRIRAAFEKPLPKPRAVAGASRGISAISLD